MKDGRLVKTSKFLSFVLRHKPERIGLKLDKHGWADVEALIARAREAGLQIDEPLLHRIVAENDKRRFSFNDDRTKIRANQGHSIAVDLGLRPIPPPEILYHGTATRFLESIEKKGLLAGQRQHVHLSGDEKTAVSVGKRHGKPVVLGVKSGQMAAKGHKFYRSANGVWLVDKVPVEYIVFPE